MTALADALAQKSARLERSVRLAREELAAAVDFMTDFSLPGSAREVFATLQREGVIDADLAAALGRMVGFRNIAVHEYRSLDVAIVVAVIRHELDGLLRFAGLLLSRQIPDSN